MSELAESQTGSPPDLSKLTAVGDDDQDRLPDMSCSPSITRKIASYFFVVAPVHDEHTSLMARAVPFYLNLR